MTIARGDRIPSVPIKLVGAGDTIDTTSDAVLGQGLVVFFGVPGAFTPTCDTSHLPGFIANTAKFKALGVSKIVCGTVNDHHVTKAWAERSDAIGKIEFIADGEGNLADALGLSKQMAGMGKRFARFAMIIEDGVVRDLFVQDVTGVTVSGAPAILMALQSAQVTA
ncbi:redoxin family protein [Devosia sp. CN2-171]|uniref:redoxin family protein n=1 Tax=Devosia sp. CN2-171 TaxID=3400909 RepID=UPI003BF7B77A